MKKDYLGLLLTCVIGMTSISSCSSLDNPVPAPVPIVTETLTGDWLYVYEYPSDGDQMVGREVATTLINFAENGVMTQKSYIGNSGASIETWERWRRHGLYTVNEAANTMIFEGIGNEVETVSYSLTEGQLVFDYYNTFDEEMKKAIFLRPEAGDLEFLDMIDKKVASDDYVGKWFGYKVYEDIGITIYMMLDFTEDGIINVRRYSVDHYNDCMRSVYSQYYEESDEEDGMKIIMMHDSKDYSKTYSYWWTVEDNILTLGDPEDEEDDFTSSYHPLSPDDIVLLEELDKLVKE